MTVKDDRTEEQKQAMAWIVVGTDRCLSGWGGAQGGASYAGWACKPEDIDKVERWVSRRGDQTRVRLVGPGYRPNPAYCAHFHVYPVHPGHPALR